MFNPLYDWLDSPNLADTPIAQSSMSEHAVVDEPSSSLTDDILDVSEQVEMEVSVFHSCLRQSKLLTFVFKGPISGPDAHSRLNFLAVDHGDHHHIIFRSDERNKVRSVSNLLLAFRADPDVVISVQTSVQPVVNWNRFAAYLVRNAFVNVQCFGRKVAQLAWELQNVTREENGCANISRVLRSSSQKFESVKRKNRIDYLPDLVEEHDARSLLELKNSLTFADRKSLYSEIGNQWKEAAELCIEAYCESLRQKQQTTRFETYIPENNHTRICTYPEDTTAGMLWLDTLLTVNNIEKHDFLTNLSSIMNKGETRRNAFVLQGPKTTGKSP
ncbi:unnamed protein product [Echinostoma caproni]|uniref:VirE_N domain-containing protein n=1 Tax=Echinostoma caproni TaxID=27848 RepID=A0A183ADP5_9TREM|nr:unnamed protein product [Echinostoma caproni]